MMRDAPITVIHVIATKQPGSPRGSLAQPTLPERAVKDTFVPPTPRDQNCCGATVYALAESWAALFLDWRLHRLED